MLGRAHRIGGRSPRRPAGPIRALLEAFKAISRAMRRAAPRPPPPDFDRADRIGEFWGHPESRACGELLIDLEEILEPAELGRVLDATGEDWRAFVLLDALGALRWSELVGLRRDDIDLEGRTVE
jgi:integrase